MLLSRKAMFFQELDFKFTIIGKVQNGKKSIRDIFCFLEYL